MINTILIKEGKILPKNNNKTGTRIDTPKLNLFLKKKETVVEKKTENKAVFRRRIE